MDKKINITSTGSSIEVQLEPVVNLENLGEYICDVMCAVPELLMRVCSYVPLLRPACDEEREAHVYVFAEGEQGEKDNALYKYREQLYDTMAAVFSASLSTLFPDIEYIKACRLHQQELCSTHTEEEIAEYQQEVSRVVQYVRDNFEELNKEAPDEEEDSTSESTDRD